VFCAKQHFQGGRGPTDDHPHPLPVPADEQLALRSTSAASVKRRIKLEQNMGSSDKDKITGIYPLPL